MQEAVTVNSDGTADEGVKIEISPEAVADAERRAENVINAQVAYIAEQIKQGKLLYEKRTNRYYGKNGLGQWVRLTK